MASDTIPAHNNILLELHVPDFKQVKDFYLKLGFEIVWEETMGGPSNYLVLKLGNNILCFWPGNESVNEQTYFKSYPPNTTRGYGVEIVIMVEDIDTFYVSAKDSVEVVEPLKKQPWGLKDFRIADPFGYYLRFTSHHNILDPKNAVSKNIGGPDV